jgi:hypothetical protein
MAILKKDSIIFSSGRQIDIPGGIVSITKSLELTDYYSRNILFYDYASKGNKQLEPVRNIYSLTTEELVEVADCMIQLWINLKDNTRKLGINSPDIFNIKQKQE